MLKLKSIYTFILLLGEIKASIRRERRYEMSKDLCSADYRAKACNTCAMGEIRLRFSKLTRNFKDITSIH